MASPGLTSNPSIFAHSITTDARYAAPIAKLLPSIPTSIGVYEELALQDLKDAAALLRPLYDSLHGADGFVSMEVSPHLAYDTPGSLAEARRLWGRLQLPNALIKIPGTEAGLPVIRDLIAAGINVNVTLLFSPERYRAVAQAYMDGLSARAAQGHSRGAGRLGGELLPQPHRHRRRQAAGCPGRPRRGAPRARCAARRRSPAPAAPMRSTRRCSPARSGRHWPACGARPQRLLWASTSAKDPTFSPVKYVEELVVPDTVNTMPLETLNTYRRVGRPALRLERHIAEAADQREAFERIGIDLEAVAAAARARGRHQVHRTIRQAAAVASEQARRCAGQLTCGLLPRGHSGQRCDTRATAAPGRRTARARGARRTAACATRPIRSRPTSPSR